MQVTILDTVTGKTAIVGKLTEYDLTDGYLSCDCNRSLAFKDETFHDDLEDEMHAQHPELLPHQSYCFGEKRFIVVKAEYDRLEEFLYLNSSYDETLVARTTLTEETK